MIRTMTASLLALFKFLVSVSKTFFVFGSAILLGKVGGYRPDRPAHAISAYVSGVSSRMIWLLIVLMGGTIRTIPKLSSSCKLSFSCNHFCVFRTIRTMIANLSAYVRVCVRVCACAGVCVHGKPAVYRPVRPAVKFNLNYQ